MSFGAPICPRKAAFLCLAERMGVNIPLCFQEISARCNGIADLSSEFDMSEETADQVCKIVEDLSVDFDFRIYALCAGAYGLLHSGYFHEAYDTACHAHNDAMSLPNNEFKSRVMLEIAKVLDMVTSK